MCRFQFLLPDLQYAYFFSKEHELAQNGYSLQVLSKCPAVVSNYGTIEVGVEKESHDSSEGNQVVTFDHI